MTLHYYSLEAKKITYMPVEVKETNLYYKIINSLTIPGFYGTMLKKDGDIEVAHNRETYYITIYVFLKEKNPQRAIELFQQELEDRRKKKEKEIQELINLNESIPTFQIVEKE